MLPFNHPSGSKNSLPTDKLNQPLSPGYSTSKISPHLYNFSACNTLLLFILIIIITFTLKYCIGFATHLHESAMSVHMFPIPNPSPTRPPRHTHTIAPGHSSAPAPSILHPASNPDWQFISYMILYCFNAILPNHPTLALSHRVQKTVLYICVSFAVLHTGLSLPYF